MENSAEAPFFFNSKGKALYQAHGTPISWTDFEDITGLHVTSYSFRHHQSSILASSQDCQVSEAEKYILCHSEATRQKAYTAEKTKKLKAVSVQNWYQEALQQALPKAQAMNPVNRKQQEERAKQRFGKQQQEMDAAKLEKLCKAEVAAAEASTGRVNVITVLEKIALLQALRSFSSIQ